MSERIIMIYEIDDYADNGGGTYVEYFDSKQELIDKVNELHKEDKRFGKFDAYILGNKIKIEPVERVTKYEIA